MMIAIKSNFWDLERVPKPQIIQCFLCF